MSKIKISGEIKVNTYNLLADCVEDGIGFGWQRAFKHTDTPDADLIKEQIYMEVMNKISEHFVFEDYFKE